MIKNQIFWWYNNYEHFYFGFQYDSWKDSISYQVPERPHRLLQQMDGQSNVGKSQHRATSAFPWKKSRNLDPTTAIVDSQSIKGTPESHLESGLDGGKLIKGRKRNCRYNGLSWYCSGVRSQRIWWESGSSAHNGSVLIPSYHHKNLGRQWLFRPGAFRLALASNSGAWSRSLENKPGFPASTCYLVDRWLKEPLLG